MVGMNGPAERDTATRLWEEQRIGILFNAAIAMGKTSKPLAGIIVEKGAPEYTTLRPLLTKTEGQCGTSVLVGILDREPILGILRAMGEHDVAHWIEQEAAPSTRAMPTVIATIKGMEALIDIVPDLKRKTS